MDPDCGNTAGRVYHLTEQPDDKLKWFVYDLGRKEKVSRLQMGKHKEKE